MLFCWFANIFFKQYVNMGSVPYLMHVTRRSRGSNHQLSNHWATSSPIWSIQWCRTEKSCSSSHLRSWRITQTFLHGKWLQWSKWFLIIFSTNHLSWRQWWKSSVYKQLSAALSYNNRGKILSIKQANACTQNHWRAWELIAPGS